MAGCEKKTQTFPDSEVQIIPLNDSHISTPMQHVWLTCINWQPKHLKTADMILFCHPTQSVPK